MGGRSRCTRMFGNAVCHSSGLMSNLILRRELKTLFISVRIPFLEILQATLKCQNNINVLLVNPLSLLKSIYTQLTKSHCVIGWVHNALAKVFTSQSCSVLHPVDEMSRRRSFWDACLRTQVLCSVFNQIAEGVVIDFASLISQFTEPDRV